jgi:hypothetical protein
MSECGGLFKAYGGLAAGLLPVRFLEREKKVSDFS